MNPSIRASSGCSFVSGEAFVLRPRPSRLLKLWWYAVHGLAGLGIAGVPLWPALKCFALAGLLAHAWWRVPPLAPLLIKRRNGSWAAPELGRTELRPLADTSYGLWWVRLILADARGTVRWLLLRDQLDPAVWRALQVSLRRTADIM